MGLWSRVWNLFRAILFQNVKEMEVEHAEAVYDSAIEKKVESFHQLKHAVGALVARREKLALELETSKRDYKQVRNDLEGAIATNNTQLGPILLQKKEQLEDGIERLKTDLEQSVKEVEDYKGLLIEMQGSITTLKVERERALARAASDKERIRIENEIAGLSVEPELAALDNVREGLSKLHGEAVVSKELGETDLDRQLSRLRREAAPTTAKAKFAELVKQTQTGQVTSIPSQETKTQAVQQQEIQKTLGEQQSS
ncbi:MAG: PspA/IM30 family protein [Candidatus Latescibacteria bacterium]|nr:PspA/IM30 family protein [Candidatus Latescibacterota bacterium]